MASATWLGVVLVANQAGAGVNPAVAVAGALIAPVFGAGPLSPDADVSWLSFLGHRKATHRLSTAAVLLGVTGVVWLLVAAGEPLGALLWAPVVGWCSHLAGDAVFGRIPVGRRYVGLGLDTDGLLERGNLRLRSRTASGLHRTKRVLPFGPTTLALSVATLVLGWLVFVQAPRASALTVLAGWPI